MKFFLKDKLLTAALGLVALAACQKENDNSNQYITKPGAHVGYYETTKKTNADSALVGWTVAAFPVSQSLLTDGKQQWVAFYDQAHRMTIAQRELPDGPWHYCVLDQRIEWDSHNYVTMTRAQSGVIYISGNMHGAPLVMYKTDETGDIATLSRVNSLTGKNESKVTYPKFLRLKDGRTIFHYRDGYSGNGNEIYDVLNEDGSWSRFLDQPLTDGEKERNAYMTEPILDNEGNYHLVWVWRETGDCSTNHDVCHAWSPNLKDWYAADGTQMTLPMKLSDSKLIVDPVPVKGGMINNNQKIGFDTQNRPVVTYHKYDSDGNIQVWVARFENGAWHRVQMTDWDWRWDFSGGGTMIFELRLNAPVQERNGQITVKYSRYHPSTGKTTSGEIWIDGTTLEYVKEASPRSTASTLPSWVGKIQTKFDGILHVQKSSDLGGGRYILRWEAMDSNRDSKPEGEFCYMSEMRVVKF